MESFFLDFIEIVWMLSDTIAGDILYPKSTWNIAWDMFMLRSVVYLKFKLAGHPVLCLGSSNGRCLNLCSK
jgi:hypothetical protein